MKQLLLGLIFCRLISLIYSEEIIFKTLRKSNLYDNNTSSLDLKRNFKGIIYQNEKVIYANSYSGILMQRTDQGRFITISILYNQKEFDIASNDIIPLDNEILFDESFISELNKSDRQSWILSYYIDVLQSKERETLFDHAPFYSDKDNPAFDTYSENGFINWYEYFVNNFPNSNLCISNSAIVINDTIGFVIKEIGQINNGYRITARFENDSRVGFEIENLDFSTVYDKEYFDIILIQDGDYLDVYLEDLNHKLTSYVQLDQEMIAIIKDFISTNSYDESKVTWPRRRYKTAIEGKTYRILENLRLRNGESTKSEILATLAEGTKVIIVNNGKREIIDNVEASWVEVELHDGRRGWCFGGYLSSVPEGKQVEKDAAGSNIR